MKYNYKVWEDNKKVVLEGETSGRGTRKEQEEEARLEAMKKGYKTRLDSRYSLQMKATMTREECEKRILEKLKEIKEIYEEYNPNADYLSLFVRKDFLQFNNVYWAEDSKHPLNGYDYLKEG